ncbi:MAG: glycosyl transferase family 36 [Candidatus Omnitrophica bacterium]|nr:glycosyl transferase family 36 [Candidatus Omnitrophota bacterium]
MGEILVKGRRKTKSMKKEEMSLKTDYGYFTKEGREYVITRPDTPMPWINVVCNGDYGFVVSQTGSGFSWYKNANLSRINRWDQDLITDTWGKYIYIRDEKTKKFWSVSWKPVCPKFEKYRVTQGIGYTKIYSLYENIGQELLLFVPPDEPLEIWELRLKNLSSHKRKLNLFSYFELLLGNALDPHREFQKTFIETEFDEKRKIFWGRKRKIPVPDHISTGLSEYPISCFHSVNIEPIACEGEKRNFIGMYRGPQNPLALEKKKLTNTTGRLFDSIASLQIELELSPREEKRVVFLLGSCEDEGYVKELVEKYRNIENVELAFQKTRDFWEKLLSGISVETPDPAFNFMTNYWLKYQAISGRLWARTAYYQSSGGFGFRDQLQDSLACLPLEAELTKRQIILHAQHQFLDGTVYHWWHNLIERGAHIHISDNLLWLVYISLHYLNETGDFSIFDERIKYVDGPEEPLYNHCIKAIDKVLSRFSPRGLPLIGSGDWNDGLSSVGLEWKGESIWLGHFLYGILIQFVPLCEKRNDLERANNYRKRAEELKENINKYAWDGAWYIRATKDNGGVLGSSSCEEGKIFLNSQTWAVIHGTATPERAEECMDSVEKILLREYGPLLFYPGYTKPDKEIGYLSRYGEGLRENGGVYTHAATWAIIAEVILKRAEKAYEIYSKICPAKRGLNPKVYMAEPYVTPGNIDGPQSAYFGRGGWTWYSGSAAWLFKVSCEWVLGIRPTLEGLIIDPCIPGDWSGFKVIRKFRGATYEIEIENPEKVSFGIKEILLDETRLDKPIIPPLSDGKIHQVRVVLG